MKLVDLIIEEHMPIRDRLAAQYSIEPPDAAGTIVVQLKSKLDFPYKIKPNGESVQLLQGDQPRINMPIKFRKVKDCKTIDDAFETIAKRHNKNTQYVNGKQI